jgi:DNA-binding GntR family transcriptional regulator
MNRLTETKLEREIRISFAYIDHITDQACNKLDELKKEFEPKAVEQFYRNQTAVLIATLQENIAAQNAALDRNYFNFQLTRHQDPFYLWK